MALPTVEKDDVLTARKAHRPMTMTAADTVKLHNGRVDSDAAADSFAPIADSLSRIRNLLSDRFRGQAIRIYEAGGGSLSPLPPELLNSAEITVVDIDDVQVRTNRYATITICGDIQQQRFPANSFDLVVCYNVIEHIERPDRALVNFFDALKPGGWAYIAAPNPQSLSGFATRFTPHWFHVWYYRTILGAREAGMPGKAPFPVVYSALISPPKLMEFCRRTGYRIVHFNSVESTHLVALKQRYPLLGGLLLGLVRLTETVSGKSLRLGDYHLILEKPAAGA
jgi:SAM-dependent methyltransferase